MCFTLTQGVEWICRQSSGITKLRMNTRARSAEADREISMHIHRGASHPPPRCIRLISALLINSDWSGSHIAQFKPAHSCHPTRAYGVIADDRFVVAKVSIAQPKH